MARQIATVKDTKDFKRIFAEESRYLSDRILKEYVAPVVEDILYDFIDYEVYDAYEPVTAGWLKKQTYHRRHALQKSIVSRILPDGTLLTTSNATPDGPVDRNYSFYDVDKGGFLKMLENGNMGFWTRQRNQLLPRPVIGHAQVAVDQSVERGGVKRAIDKGLKRVQK